MASSGPFPSRWSTRQYILAAIAGTLATSALVIVFSVVFSPAHVHFFVTGASIGPSGADGSGRFLNFTLAANNPSRRVGVKYCDLRVSLQLYSASERTESVQATVHEPLPFEQPTKNFTNVAVSAFFIDGFVKKNFAGGSAPPMRVTVVAEVKFKVWLLKSRPYSVAVSCSPIGFLAGDSPAAAATIGCVA